MLARPAVVDQVIRRFEQIAARYEKGLLALVAIRADRQQLLDARGHVGRRVVEHFAIALVLAVLHSRSGQ
jgi:hypothetical protein